ncbi:hypothetical protein [Burkholderia cenocepacia]|uniref:hypothetical protein n=1 Tax=Burkholderia cenocepacia TaxID=95486 RepID=UPI001CF2D4DF|nr:hypothetical protein [Burkholderia cenocepacia]MCA8233123.1 hypothetical protein [Burkholderia cenocepacia]
MKRKQYSLEQIVTALKQGELGTTVTAPARGGLAQYRPLLLDESFGRTFQDVARDAILRTRRPFISPKVENMDVTSSLRLISLSTAPLLYSEKPTSHINKKNVFLIHPEAFE